MLIALLLALLLAACEAGAEVKLTPVEAAAWQQQLCPLPREVALTGKLTVPVSKLRLQLSPSATELDSNLLRELQSALEARTGIKPNFLGPLSTGACTLDFRRRPEDRTLLGSKRHADQAYCLQSVTTGGRVSLQCQALTEHGSYFGMKTLKQLLVPTVRGTGVATTVDVPLGKIVDWPDLEERGQWGGTAESDLPWLTDLKYNLLEVHADLTVDAQGVGHATMRPAMMAKCRQYGVRVVPIIHHLEQLVHNGLFEAYPMIKAKGVDLKNPGQQPICFAQPEIIKPLTDWLVDLSRVPDVTEVMIWLSEEGKGCACEECQKAVRFVQELNTCVKALRAAQQVTPGLQLRVLLTQGSYPENDKVLAALPADVKVSYYDGGRTYNTERKPMIYPVLEEFLKQKRWLGVYPTLSSNWLTVAPFSNPEFTHYRLAEFVDKGLRNLCAYIVPTDLYYPVNTEGGLEWAWNAHGRTPHEFAVSYAVRHGLKDPELFARWTELIGPPAWDLYASNYPYLESWGAPLVQIAAGKMKFPLGKSVFAAFQTPAQFTQNVARCDEALKLAETLGDPQFLAETKIVRGYTLALEAIYQLSQLMPGDGELKPENRDAVGKWLKQADAGLEAVTSNYRPWSETCQAGLGQKPPERFSATLTLMEKLAASMGELGEKFGFPDESKPYRLHVIGSWQTEDFAASGWLNRRLDVTPLVNGPGTYVFRPVYRNGTLGLGVDRVALVSYAKDQPDATREEVVDAHHCHAGAWVEGDLYTLKLTTHDPARGYALLAHIGGGNTTLGDFYFRKLRE